MKLLEIIRLDFVKYLDTLVSYFDSARQVLYTLSEIAALICDLGKIFMVLKFKNFDNSNIHN